MLYFSPKTLTQHQLVAGWWIPTADANSPTNNGRTEESFTFSLEQPLRWNPDVRVVTTPDELTQAYAAARLGSVKAMSFRSVRTTGLIERSSSHSPS